jgi:alpha-methylacyl-CoA racemase
LSGLRVVEFASIGPGPHCAMLLADLGAEIVRLERPGGNGWPNPIVDRGRATIVVDLKQAADRDRCVSIVNRADVLIEGFRPGVMDRLGLGPDLLLAQNPSLIYTRITGWGQTGPLARAVGHDIDYVALSGALAAIGPSEGPPVPPLNLVGDFAGGSLVAALGILAALRERDRSGRGQVIDAAIVDGVASLMSMFTGLRGNAAGSLERDRSLLGGAAPFYRCYLCSDGLAIAVGALEPPFYAEFVRLTDAPAEFFAAQHDRDNWARRTQVFAELIARRSRAEWLAIFAGTDACVAPALTLEESTRDEHLRARGTYVDVDGVTQNSPIPRFSRTPGQIPRTQAPDELLRRWGLGDAMLRRGSSS